MENNRVIAPTINMKNIYKTFGKVKALSDVSFYLEPGEIRALVGENGAGKTTLMNILYGMYKHDEGEIYINDEKVPDKWSPYKAIQYGLGMIHQHFSLVLHHNVLENVVMPTLSWTDFKPDWKACEKIVRALIEEHHFDVKPYDLVEGLPIGQRQQVEIIKALYQGARTLILDEPSNVLSPLQVDALFKLLKELKEKQFSIVLVTHKLSEVMSVSDKITILRDGLHVDTVETDKITVQQVAKMMVDREHMNVSKSQRKLQDKDCIFEMIDVNIENENNMVHCQDISFILRRGEILGIAGAAGSGQREISEAILGLKKINSGDMLLEGKSIKNDSIYMRRIAGIGYIPEDRHTYGIVPDMSIAENIVLDCVGLPPFSKRGILDHQAIKQNGKTAIADYFIKAESEAAIARTLSGGNQQKVILARTLMGKPKLIVACNPTRGLDFSATEYLRKKLVESAMNNMGVIIYSSDLEEIMELADRILVIYHGRVMGIIDRENVDMEQLGMMMAGVSESSTQATEIQL
ncbi:MAG: ABC transporter ATP-binding protein [Firmicutes bacterium]|nr:ABC transporter ATP-binding protein [Bacillota bacterium]